MAKKAKYPWEIRKISYSEWGKMDFDWANQYKVDYTCESYFFRYDNYHKGLLNEHIMKSTFGKMSITDIKKEINNLFEKCIGAYTLIEYE